MHTRNGLQHQLCLPQRAEYSDIWPCMTNRITTSLHSWHFTLETVISSPEREYILVVWGVEWKRPKWCTILKLLEGRLTQDVVERLKECRSVGGGWPICCCSETGAKNTSTTRSAKYSSPHEPKNTPFPPQTNPLCTPWQLNCHWLVIFLWAGSNAWHYW